MAKNIKHFYEFGCFQIDLTNGQLLRDGVPVPLTPKAFELLVVLVKHAGEVLGKDELLKLVWPDINVTPKIISVNMTALRKAIEDDAEASQYIVTIPKRGYKFVAEVREVTSNPAELPDQEPELDQVAASRFYTFPININQITGTFRGHHWYILAGCGIYASHYLTAILLEVTYKFDIYGTKALIAAPIFFCWILITSVWGLAVASKAALRGKGYGLALGVSVFVAAAIVAFLGAWFVLPHTPVTEAKFQTYAAHAAYLKDIAYILPIALLFLIVPFHFVVVLEQEIKQGRANDVFESLSGSRLSIRPAGTIYIKIWVMGSLLTGWVAYSLPARAHLFDNLLPSPYLGWFEVLHQTRTILQFALGLYCMAWYYWALNRLKKAAIFAN